MARRHRRPPADLQFDGYNDRNVAEGTTATITTSCGDIVIELDPVSSPETVKSFVFLTEQGYFDGTAMHRIMPGFMIQAGDPTATGRGGPGYFVPDEFPEAGFAYSFGVVAMANAGPNSTGSQFFIMVAEAGLSPNFSPFGNVIAGEETLFDIIRVPLASSRAASAASRWSRSTSSPSRSPPRSRPRHTTAPLYSIHMSGAFSGAKPYRA